MAGLLTLRDIYEKKGKEFIDKLFNNKVLVTEKLRGSTVYIQRNNYKGEEDYSLFIYKRDDRSPITKIDKLLMKYYDKAIDHIESLPKEILMMIPPNWRFKFQYFPNTAPVNIIYDKLPKNHLVLTSILIKNDTGKTIRIIDNPSILNDWSVYLKVQKPPVLFHGNLDAEQKKELVDYIETSSSDLTTKFGTDSFVKFILGILNPKLKSTSLNNDLEKPIDSIVFRFLGNKEEVVSAKIVDPVIKSMHTDKDTSKRSNDIYSIVLLDILEFLEKNPKIITTHILSTKPDERYIELMSHIFNEYVDENGHKYDDIDFQVPEFAQKKDFDLNINLVTNQKTKDYLEKSDAYKTLFKIFISTFRKRRRKTGTIITKPITTLLNRIIIDIKKYTVPVITESTFKTYSEYLNMKMYNESIYFDEDETIELITEDISSDELITEEIKMEHFNTGKKEVNIVVGRYQPFTIGHLKVAKKLYDKNKKPVVIVVIRGKKSDPIRRPFDEVFQHKMFKQIVKKYSYIEDYIILEGSAAINFVWDNLRPKYEPIMWGMGVDRQESFSKQATDYQKEINLHKDFKVFPIARDDDNVSATIVRQAILNNDKNTYEKMVPKEIHNMFGEMKIILDSINEDNIKYKRDAMYAVFGKIEIKK